MHSDGYKSYLSVTEQHEADLVTAKLFTCHARRQIRPIVQIDTCDARLSSVADQVQFSLLLALTYSSYDIVVRWLLIMAPPIASMYTWTHSYVHDHVTRMWTALWPWHRQAWACHTRTEQSHLLYHMAFLCWISWGMESLAIGSSWAETRYDAGCWWLQQ